MIDNPNYSLYKDIIAFTDYIKGKYSTIQPPIYLLMGLKNCPDIEIFINASKQGCLYDIVDQELGTHDKSIIKKLFMVLAFGNAKRDLKSGLETKFAKSFPNLIKVFIGLKLYFGYVFMQTKDRNLLKLRYTRGKKKPRFKTGNNYLPIALQRMESEIFIQNILKRLYDENLIALSKHDSILCKLSDADKVEKIMKEELDRMLGTGNYLLRKKLLTEPLIKQQEVA